MSPDVEAFRAAWQTARTVAFEEKPVARVQAALDRLSAGVAARVAHGSTADAALRPFLAAVRAGDGTTSDPASLDAKAFRDGERLLVDVRMGYASSVAAFGRGGRRLAVPASLRWSYRQFGAFFRTGDLVAFDGMSLSDAGGRYAFRLAFLRRTPAGYVSAGIATGENTYDFDGGDSPRLVAKGVRVTLESLDTPKAFSLTNADDLLRRRETWDTSGSVARRIAVRLLDPDVRAVDDWLWAHRGQSVQGVRVPRESRMAENIRRGRGWVQLEVDNQPKGLVLRFELAIVGTKKVVRRVKTVQRRV